MNKRNFFIVLCLILLVAISATLVACNETEYTVTFGGDGIEDFTQTVAAGKTATEPTDVTRVGYTLSGWKLDGEDYDFTAPVNSDIKLTAVWTANKYTVTLGTDDNAQTKEVTFGETYDLGTAMTDKFKEFVGWEYNGTLITNENGVSLAAWDKTENITVQPKWTDGITIDGLTYTEQEDGNLTVSTTKAYSFDNVVEIKSELNGKKVTKIGAMQFMSAYELKVPSTVKEISASAFLNNVYVNIVDLSAFNGTIGDNAFKNSELAIIDLGSTKAIGASAFENSKLGAVVIPATVTSLGDKALSSENLYEVSFAGAIPTLGKNVFGNGVRDNTNSIIAADRISIFATSDAWNAFTEGNNLVSEINKLLGVEKSNPYSITAEAMTEYLEKAGIFTLDNTKVYRGAGSYAVIVRNGNYELADIYDDTHYYISVANSARETYVFDYQNKKVIKATANEKGETILNGTLYEYQGSDIVYTVPENVTTVAGGIANGNQTLRFLIMGDNVERVGDYAFAHSNLFGVSFGKNLKAIGDYAFFNLSYLREAIFNGTEAPIIGSGAFFNLLDGVTLMPTFMANDVSRYGLNLIYTPLSIESSGPWWAPEPPACQPYIDAFNESLKGVDGIENVQINGKPVEYTKYDSYYGTGQIAQLSTDEDGTYSLGKEYNTHFGKIKMTGALSPSSIDGYAIVEFNDTVEYDIGYAYYTSVNLPGYTESDAPISLTVVCGIDAEGFVSFNEMGKFTADAFILRGAEAGAYGEFDKDKLTLDGFGKYSMTYENGTTVDGTYTVQGSAIKLEGINANVTFDSSNNSISFNNDVLTLVGEEAGVYYDKVNGAKITMDGKAVSITVNVDDQKTVINYNGTLVLEFNGEVTTTYYQIEHKKILFEIDGNKKEWTYESSGSYRVQGYYGPGSYDNQLTFANAVQGTNGTFKLSETELTVDGYYTVTLKSGTDTKTGKYYGFANSNSILLTIGNEQIVVYLDSENDTFAYATAPETGKWATSTSTSYSWYLDGKGNLLYFSGSAYDIGTYTYNATTKAFAVTYKGEAADNNEVGTLDAEAGVGTIVWKVGSNNSYAGISKTGFDESYTTTSFIGALDGSGEIVTTNPYFTINKVGNVLLVGTSGNPVVFIQLNSELANGTHCTFEYSVVKNDVKITATYQITFSEKDGKFEANILPINYYTAQSGTVKDGDTEYNVSFIDSTHAIVWKMGSSSGDVLVSGEVKNNDGTTFTIGEYTVTGYGTVNAKIEKIQTPAA